MTERQQDILKVATQLISADLNNGIRTEWLHEISRDKLIKIIDRAFDLAVVMVIKTEEIK